MTDNGDGSEQKERLKPPLGKIRQEAAFRRKDSNKSMIKRNPYLKNYEAKL